MWKLALLAAVTWIVCMIVLIREGVKMESEIIKTNSARHVNITFKPPKK